jgi:hypothetical protein
MTTPEIYIICIVMFAWLVIQSIGDDDDWNE